MAVGVLLCAKDGQAYTALQTSVRTWVNAQRVHKSTEETTMVTTAPKTANGLLGKSNVGIDETTEGTRHTAKQCFC